MIQAMINVDKNKPCNQHGKPYVTCLIQLFALKLQNNNIFVNKCEEPRFFLFLMQRLE